MTRWQSRNDKQCRDYDMMTSSFFYSLCHHVSTPHREDKMMMMHNYPPDQSKVRNHFAKEELITGEIDLYSHKLILLLLSISFCCTVLVIELSITSLSLSLSSQLPPLFAGPKQSIQISAKGSKQMHGSSQGWNKDGYLSHQQKSFYVIHGHHIIVFIILSSLWHVKPRQQRE